MIGCGPEMYDFYEHSVAIMLKFMNNESLIPTHRRQNHGGSEGTCPHSLAAMGAVPPY